MEEPLSHAYEQSNRIDVSIFVNDKRTPRKNNIKRNMGKYEDIPSH